MEGNEKEKAGRRAIIEIVIAVVIAFVIGLWLAHRYRHKPDGGLPADATVTEEVTTRTDTATHRAPAANSQIALGTFRYKLPECRLDGGGFGNGFGTGLLPRLPSQPGQKEPDDGTAACGDSAGAETLLGYGGTLAACGDSAAGGAEMELPVIQRHYSDSTYEAWVSGPLDPRLDSVRVFARTVEITRREWKPPKHWHLGITAGYGYTPQGFQPYIGIGITYSILSWK